MLKHRISCNYLYWYEGAVENGAAAAIVLLLMTDPIAFSISKRELPTSTGWVTHGFKVLEDICKAPAKYPPLIENASQIALYWADSEFWALIAAQDQDRRPFIEAMLSANKSQPAP